MVVEGYKASLRVTTKWIYPFSKQTVLTLMVTVLSEEAMSLSLYLPLYSRDAEFAAMLYLAGSRDKIIGSGLFYYPLYLCSDGDEKALMVDPLNGEIRIQLSRTNLSEMVVQLEEGRRSYESHIKAVSEVKSKIEEADLEEMVIGNVVSDLNVIAETYDYLTEAGFTSLEDSKEVVDKSSIEVCEVTTTYHKARNGLLLTVSALNELLETVREGEEFVLGMMDREKEVQLRVYEEEITLLRQNIDDKIRDIEAKMEKETDRILKKTSKKKRSLETQIKKITKKYWNEKKKVTMYREKSIKTKRSRWKIMAEEHVREAEKLRSMLKKLEKELSKKEKEENKTLKEIESEGKKKINNEINRFEEKRRKKREIIQAIEEKKRNLKIMCKSLIDVVQGRLEVQIKTLKRIEKCLIEAPFKERAKICVPFIAVRRRGKIPKNFDFVFPRKIDKGRGGGFLWLSKPRLQRSVEPRYEHLFSRLVGNLSSNLKRGELIPRLIEGTAGGLLKEERYNEIVDKGLEGLVNMNLVKREEALRYISRLRGKQ